MIFTFEMCFFLDWEIRIFSQTALSMAVEVCEGGGSLFQVVVFWSHLQHLCVEVISPSDDTNMQRANENLFIYFDFIIVRKENTSKWGRKQTPSTTAPS